MHPVLVHIGAFQLRSYEVLAALGVVSSFVFLRTRQGRMSLRGGADYWALVNALVASGFVGARLVGVLFAEPTAAATLSRRLFSIGGNFSVFGLIAGVSAGAWLYSRVHRLSRVRLLDYVAFCVPIWVACGRLGCFLNGCCYGRPTRGRWACSVTFDDPRAAMPRDLLGVPLHPAQLYEAGGCVVLVVVLYVVLRGTERGRYPQGWVFAACLAGYGALRFVVEWSRGDVAPLPGTLLTVAQVWCVALIVGAAVFVGLLARSRRIQEPTRTPRT